tara:strand:+ start:2200 stop:2424 length:225 start_codon:yes stop_codon:yes gene_type:complete
MGTNPKKVARQSARADKKLNRKVKKHAKWAGLDMNNPEEAATARKSYKGLTEVSMRKGGKVPKSNYNVFDMQPS